MKKISEISVEEKDDMLEEASNLLKDYEVVKDRPEEVRKLFKRKIAKELRELYRRG